MALEEEEDWKIFQRGCSGEKESFLIYLLKPTFNIHKNERGKNVAECGRQERKPEQTSRLVSCNRILPSEEFISIFPVILVKRGSQLRKLVMLSKKFVEENLSSLLKKVC